MSPMLSESDLGALNHKREVLLCHAYMHHNFPEAQRILDYLTRNPFDEGRVEEALHPPGYDTFRAAVVRGEIYVEGWGPLTAAIDQGRSEPAAAADDAVAKAQAEDTLTEIQEAIDDEVREYVPENLNTGSPAPTAKPQGETIVDPDATKS